MRFVIAWGLQMSSQIFSLGQLGWRACYSQQLTLQDLETSFPARVASVHRGLFAAWSERGEIEVPAPINQQITVGDWVLLDHESSRVARVLDRHTLVSRLAAGTGQRLQPIAANLDTLFIVTSCNDDFNLSRLERYLAVGHEATVETVIVLTKTDLCADVARLIAEIGEVAPRVPVIGVNALATASVASLLDWLLPASTVAFVGSSGVGKSTLVNTLSGVQQATSAIRDDDSKGRHTTTARQLIAMPNGAWLIDTPGMRELKVGAVETGIRATFEDVELLAAQCRFRDCTHGGNAGCALNAAIANGSLSQRRFDNYLKLQREARHATQSARERREADRKFGKMHKALKKELKRAREKK
jgi:ribosome biogenesis GTPase / thiamine phosphate phosphatase